MSSALLNKIGKLEAKLTSRERRTDPNWIGYLDMLTDAMDRTILGEASPELLPERWYPLRPHPSMEAYYFDDIRFKANSSGRRSGKTESTKREVISMVAAMTPPKQLSKVVFGAPTQDQSMRIFWEDLKAMVPTDLIQKDGIYESGEIYLWNNIYLQVAGMDKPARIEGDPMLGFVGDEIADMKPDAYVKHVRPGLADTKGFARLIGVPEGRNHWYDLCEAFKGGGDVSRYYHWYSDLVLDPEEIAEMARTMDDKTFQQEVRGSFVLVGGRVYYAFDGMLHASEPVKYNPNRPLIVCFDFNVEPGVALYVQEQTYRGKRSDVSEEVTAVIGEVYIPHDSNTPTVCRKIISDWAKRHKGDVYIYGDPAGGARSTKSEQGSDWDIIEAMLRPHFSVKNRVKRHAPFERVRVNAVNARCRTTDGTMHVVVDRSAKMFIRDMEAVVVKEGTNGEIDDSNKELTHLSDAFGYYIEAKHPLLGVGRGGTEAIL